MNNKIFVYGSLMRGKSNSALLRGSIFLGTATAEGLRLYRVTDPYLGAVRGEGRKVKGELFKVDPSVWEELDRLEGNDYFYRRNLPRSFLMIRERGRGPGFISGCRMWIPAWRSPTNYSRGHDPRAIEPG